MMMINVVRGVNIIRERSVSIGARNMTLVPHLVKHISIQFEEKRAGFIIAIQYIKETLETNQLMVLVRILPRRRI